MAQILAKNDEMLLDLGDSVRQRIHCGLRWDPSESGAGTTDLDLACYLFGKDGRLLEYATGDDDKRISASGNVYHTGDDTSGTDERDDERISLELFNLSRKVQHIFLIVEVKSKHAFNEVKEPRVRIAHGITDENITSASLLEDGCQGMNAFVFCRIHRSRDGWALHYIGEYINRADAKDWGETLRGYIPEDEIVKKSATAALAHAPKAGEHAPLFVTKQARHRVLCGLRWDPATEGGVFDLDLSCALFDADGDFIEAVSGPSAIDSSGAVYHSGDDTSGDGHLDDEDISVELLNLPDHVQHIVFLLEVRSNHSFGDIRNPEARIADGMTDNDQILTRLDGGGDANACVFARIYRKNGNWMLHHIGAYLRRDSVEDWVAKLREYLA